MGDEQLLVNRQNWNERTPVHAATEFYDVEGFKSGRITLTDVERREVGDVDGKTLLHLQCHFGLDTMSWARLGAKATGVDFSDAAIDLARSLNDELELNTRFIRSDVYDLPDVLDEEFDIVFTSYGVLVWLPDLDRWASTIQRLLRPGGTFYIVEFHPFVDAVEVSESGALHATYGYFHQEVSIQGNEPSYAGAQPIESPAYEWQHTLGDVTTALIEAGLRIEFLHEFPSAARKGPEWSGVATVDGGSPTMANRSRICTRSKRQTNPSRCSPVVHVRLDRRCLRLVRRLRQPLVGGLRLHLGGNAIPSRRSTAPCGHGETVLRRYCVSLRC